MQEARELANDPSTDYSAAPLEVRENSLVSLDMTRLTPSQDDIFVSCGSSRCPRAYGLIVDV